MAHRMKAVRGVAALEFLLVVPLLIILFLGIMSLSLAAGLRADLHMVARAGAQWAIQRLENAADATGIATIAGAAAADLPVAVDVSSSIVCGCLDPDTGAFTEIACSSNACPLPDPRPQAFVRVTAAADYPFPWTIPGLPDTWQLQSSAELRIR